MIDGESFGSVIDWLQGDQKKAINTGIGVGLQRGIEQALRIPRRGSAQPTTPTRSPVSRVDPRRPHGASSSATSRHGTRSPSLPNLGDPGGTLGSVRDLARQQFEDEAARLRAQYDRQIGSIGDGGAGDAIRRAQEQLRKIAANKAAIHGVYDEYAGFVNPINQSAIQAAMDMVAKATPGLEQVAADASADLDAAYTAAQAMVGAEAALIGAGSAVESQVADLVARDRDLFEKQQAMEEQISGNLLGLQAEVFRTQAEADHKVDQGQMKRRLQEVDAQFANMQEQAEEALASARRAAAAAAARRRALAADRDDELARLQSAYDAANNPPPHEFAYSHANNFLRSQVAPNVTYDRLLLIHSAAQDAVSQGITASRLRNVGQGDKATEGWFATSGWDKKLNAKELDFVRDTINSYYNSMNWYVENQNKVNPQVRIPGF